MNHALMVSTALDPRVNNSAPPAAPDSLRHALQVASRILVRAGELHAIADEAFGAAPPIPEPASAYSGATLDQLIATLENADNRLGGLYERMGRIA